jgi:hypothetical protein
MSSGGPQEFTFMKTYPAHGDSAVAELQLRGEAWGELYLEGIKLDRHGDDRLDGAIVVLRVYPRLEQAKTSRRLLRGRSEDRWLASINPWEFRLKDVLAVLDEARHWLLENERGRVPLEEGPITVAGAALSKASLDSELRRSVPPSKHDEAR